MDLKFSPQKRKRPPLENTNLKNTLITITTMVIEIEIIKMERKSLLIKEIRVVNSLIRLRKEREYKRMVIRKKNMKERLLKVIML
jgi:hypothetical protein